MVAIVTFFKIQFAFILTRGRPEPEYALHRARLGERTQNEQLTKDIKRTRRTINRRLQARNKRVNILLAFDKNVQGRKM